MQCCSAGALLSAAAPLLLLPSWAAGAAAELAALPAADTVAGLDSAAFLRTLGFLLHTAEQQAQPGAQPLPLAAAQRVTALARRLGIACAARGWQATPRLLLPAMGLGSSGAGSAAASSSSAKAPAPGGPAAAAVAASKCAGQDEQDALAALLTALEVQDDGQEAADSEQPRSLRAAAAAQAADWLWAGANLAAGVASLVLLVRNAMGGTAL